LIISKAVQERVFDSVQDWNILFIDGRVCSIYSIATEAEQKPTTSRPVQGGRGSLHTPSPRLTVSAPRMAKSYIPKVANLSIASTGTIAEIHLASSCKGVKKGSPRL
jgi:hypothetical protein